VSYNGSGVFNINTSGQPVVTGTVISSTAFNALTADLGTGLSTAITKDGQTTATARIPFAAGINSSLVTDATSTTTGSIITAGGVGIAKSLYVGTGISGALNGTVGATTPSTGAFTTLSASGATNLATGGATVSTQIGTLTAPTTNALQHLFNGAAVWMGQTTAGGETDLGWNFYYNSGFKSRVSDVASRLSFNPQSGYVSFFHAPSPGAADAALTFTESMRIQSPTTTTGVIALGTLVAATTVGVGGVTPSGSGSGVQFPATQSASTDANTLDDYEEGTWTPTLAFGGGSTGIVYGGRVGNYIKVGSLVTAQCAVDITNKGSSTGSASVSGFPFTVSGTFITIISSQLVSWTGAGPCQLLLNSGTTASFYGIPNGVGLGWTALTNTDFANTSQFYFTMVYKV
jgi:hypothetical protein